MSGLEGLGILFVTLLGVGVMLVITWVIGSTWRHGDEIQALELKVRMIEDRYRDDIARNIENEINKPRGKANGRRIKKPNRRTR